MALLGGVIRAGITPKERIVGCDVSEDQLRKAAEGFGVRTSSDSAEAVGDAEVILLAVKPQNLPDIEKQLGGTLKSNQLVISVLAGVPVARLKKALGEGPTIVRTMPNLPALIGEGMSVVANDAGDADQIHLVETILQTVGEVVLLSEKHLDAVTALSGSGPGYVYLFVEAMAEAGAAIGLPEEQAKTMARKTFIGACQLMETSGETPEELRRRVTSPGGTTAAGIQSFEEQGLREIFAKALKRSAERAAELGRG